MADTPEAVTTLVDDFIRLADTRARERHGFQSQVGQSPPSASRKDMIAASLSRLSAADRDALEAAGVEFTNGDQPGVRLAKRKGKAKR